MFHYEWKSEFRVSVAVVYLINHIVSSNSTFLTRALNLYVRSLSPPFKVGITNSHPTDSALTGTDEIIDTDLQQRRLLIHKAIRRVMDLVPTGRGVLFPILSDFFPHKRFDRVTQTAYVRQLLHICSYEPLLQHRILDLIVKKCLEMDVEIVIDDSGEVAIDRSADNCLVSDADEDVFVMDGSSSSFETPRRPTTHSLSKQLTDTGTLPSRIPPEVADTADKLDAMMEALMEFCEGEVRRGGQPFKTLSQHLLAIFEASILPVHKSKFVQFCLFHVASLDDAFARSFALRLLAVLRSESVLVASVHKQSAVMYLSSYLSRAAFLPLQFVGEQLDALVRWAACYSSSSSSSAAAGTSLGDSCYEDTPDLDELGRAVPKRCNTASRHELFYSVVQSISYILCYHGVDLVVKHSQQEGMRLLWEQIVLSQLQPYRFCLKSVRGEFLKLASCVGLFSDACWTAIPSDWVMQQQQQQTAATLREEDDSSCTEEAVAATARQKKTHARMRAGSDLGIVQLDCFFPFDPCLLYKVHDKIQSCYRVWEGVPGLEDLMNYCSSSVEGDSTADDTSLTPVGYRSSIEQALLFRPDQPHSRAGSFDSFMAGTVSRESYGGSVHMSISQATTAPSEQEQEQDELADEEEEEDYCAYDDIHLSIPAQGPSIALSGETRPRFYSIGSAGSW